MLRRSLLASGAALPLIGRARAQQTFPTKPIRLVVGYSAGGGNDLIARIVAAKLQDKLGQPVVVDNKPGAQSIVAAEIVAKAAPDGHTLLVAPSGPMTINPAVYSKLPYDPLRDFVPISLLAEFPLLLVVGADQPPKTIKELVEYGRANPKLANYASSATPFQLASELFNQRTGAQFQHIPYRGSGDAVQAVLAGQVLMTIADSGPIAGPLKAGKLRALGITTAKRPPAFPDVPTFTEQGISDMEIELWTGVVAPNGTPPDVVERLQDVIEDTVEQPAVRTALEAIYVDPRSTSSKEFRDLIVRDIGRWKAVADKANIKLD
ncbi:MAG: tripartite tricarboxylate transporter substrate binding protein [Reyranella sp.]|uniref:Bug family tripartite tricarboxylate transporter substrate binding protein n=1 Tax=Reyranella sp. TaxID=1929291 RepID=UPI001AC95FFA|nr:tripartite tricarboxylate transporter substrate binding protein [Reyranella sp.]MBN9088111.1 tripartite tricarboxylate transporter substrate binding protein [Reyranella sp.]